MFVPTARANYLILLSLKNDPFLLILRFLKFQVRVPHDLVLSGEISIQNSFRHKHHRDRLEENPSSSCGDAGILKGPTHHGYSDSR